MPRGSNPEYHGVTEQIRHLVKAVEKLTSLIEDSVDMSYEDRIVRRATRKVKAAKQRIPQTTNKPKE